MKILSLKTDITPSPTLKKQFNVPFTPVLEVGQMMIFNKGLSFLSQTVYYLWIIYQFLFTCVIKQLCNLIDNLKTHRIV